VSCRWQGSTRSTCGHGQQGGTVREIPISDRFGLDDRRSLYRCRCVPDRRGNRKGTRCRDGHCGLLVGAVRRGCGSGRGRAGQGTGSGAGAVRPTEVPSVVGSAGSPRSWASRTVLPSGLNTRARSDSRPSGSVCAYPATGLLPCPCRTCRSIRSAVVCRQASVSPRRVISFTGRTCVIRPASPMRSRPETASSSASASPASSLARRVLALPRIGTGASVGGGGRAARSARQRTCRFGYRPGRSSSVSPPGWTSASRMSSWARYAAKTVPAGTGRSRGTSFMQCTARSHAPASRAASAVTLLRQGARELIDAIPH